MWYFSTTVVDRNAIVFRFQFQEIIHERDINEGIGMFYYRIKVQFQETVCERDIVRAFIEILYFFNIRIII